MRGYYQERLCFTKFLHIAFPQALFLLVETQSCVSSTGLRAFPTSAYKTMSTRRNPPFCQRVALKSAFYEKNYRRLAFCLTLCNAKCLHFAFFFLNAFSLRVDAKSCIQYLGQVPFRPIFKTSTATLRNANVSTHGPKQKFTLLHKVSSLCFTERLHFALCQAV